MKLFLISELTLKRGLGAGKIVFQSVISARKTMESMVRKGEWQAGVFTYRMVQSSLNERMTGQGDAWKERAPWKGRNKQLTLQSRGGKKPGVQGSL